VIRVGAILLAVSLLSVGGTRVPAEAALGTIGTPGYLGDADSFAVVAGTEITNVFALPLPQTVVDGDMAVSPGTTVTGFGGGPAEGQVNNGTIYTADATAAAAKADADAAWTNVDSYGTATPLAGAELGGQNLGPGVYTPTGVDNFGLTGTLTLTGDWDDIFVFKTPSFSTANASVVVLNGANPCNIYWRINESASLGEGTTFVGTLLAGTSITVGSEADVEGRLFAGTGNVTLIHDQIATPICLTAPPVGGGPGGDTEGSELADTGVASLPVFALGGAALLVLLGAVLAARGRRSTLS
jgi:LPXTG-motif cell wall-anchored protein